MTVEELIEILKTFPRDMPVQTVSETSRNPKDGIEAINGVLLLEL